MNWKRVYERHGVVVDSNTGTLLDPFSFLGFSNPGTTMAKIEVSGHASDPEYSRTRVGIVVEIQCPQTEQHINLAAEAAFRKMVELVNDGASHLGIPGLPPVGE